MIPANWFIGLVVPAEGWFDEMGFPPRGARYFHPEDLHVSVSFLGAVDEEDAMKAWKLAKRLTGGPFSFPLGQIESFGPRQNPSAYAVVPAEPQPALDEFLAVYRNDIAQAAHARPDMRPPRPHITVARPRRRSSVSEKNALARWGETVELPEVTLTLSEVALYTWSEERDQKLFHIVDRFELPPYDPDAWPRRYKVKYL